MNSSLHRYLLSESVSKPLQVTGTPLIFFDFLRTMYPATYLRALPSLLDNDSAAVGSIVLSVDEQSQ